MIKIVRLFAAFLALISFLQVDAVEKPDWAQLGHFQYQNATLKTSPLAVFIGDSVTDCWSDSVPEFFSENNYAGRGISGQVSSQMLVRFRQDVIELNPKVVVILCGINDIAENDGRMSNKGIVDNIKSMCELAEMHNITPILCSILPCDHFHWLRNMNIYPAGRVLQVNKLIETYAHEKGYEYVDYHTFMTTNKGGMKPEYTFDCGHPNKKGFAVMMPIIKKAINKVLSSKK